MSKYLYILKMKITQNTGTHKLGQYIPRSSTIHALDPRAKIIMITTLICAIYSCKTPIAACTWALLLIPISKAAQIGIKTIIQSAKPIILLSFFSAAIQAAATRDAAAALVTGGKLALFVTYSSLLTFTTTPSDITSAIQKLMPKLPGMLGQMQNGHVSFADDIAITITMALRFIPTIFEETERIITQQKSRGTDFDNGGIIKRTRVYAAVIIPLFAVIFRRAETLAAAMQARGYTPGASRTKLHPLKWKTADTAATLITIAASVLMILMERKYK